jgi:hypothetical protein
MESRGADDVTSTFNQNRHNTTGIFSMRQRHKGTELSTKRLFISLSQIVWSVQREKHKFLMSYLCAYVQNRNAIGKPIGQQIANKPHPDYSRCQKFALFLCKHCLQLNKMFTIISRSSFVESKATILNSVYTSRRTERRIWVRLSHNL